ncbi:MAG: immunoglobulin-like domain-containing protein [Chitinophagaceae bacterium]
MKQIIKIAILSVLPLLLLTGCKKETTAGVSKPVKVSFPEITLKGEELVIIPTGGTYTDAGAKLKDDITGAITDIQPTSNPVNTAQPGLYVVTFSAANANGFEATASRLVAVTSVTSVVNRAGTYLRPATGVNCYITKLAEGVYELKNPGGAGVSPNTTTIMVETAPNVYICPPQPTDFGTMSVINISFNATGVTWNVINPGFGTGTRTFIKQ